MPDRQRIEHDPPQGGHKDAPPRRHSPAGSWQEAMREAGPYMGLGLQLALTMAACTLGGYFLDRWLNTSPWLLILGAALGMVSVFVYLIQLSNTLGKKKPTPPRKADDE